jgi:[histone H4]-N-methyl-L-lysine20 N-methyltransferase
MMPGTVITELKGSMANLSDEEDRELKRRGLENSDVRRDFSVIHSKSMKKNHLFLGPARFVNVSASAERSELQKASCDRLTNGSFHPA